MLLHFFGAKNNGIHPEKAFTKAKFIRKQFEICQDLFSKETPKNRWMVYNDVNDC